MVATISQSSSLPQKSDEQLLITQPALRMQLLKARLVDEMSAACVIQRGEYVYLSLREVDNEAQRKEVTWAVLRLQMGAIIHPQKLPDPLRTILLASMAGPSPLLQSLIWGTLAGVVGGVLVMALVGLFMTVLIVLPESYVGIVATAVAFVLPGTAIGCGATVYFWRHFTQQTAVSPPTSTLPTTVNMPK